VSVLGRRRAVIAAEAGMVARSVVMTGARKNIRARTSVRIETAIAAAADLEIETLIVAASADLEIEIAIAAASTDLEIEIETAIEAGNAGLEIETAIEAASVVRDLELIADVSHS